MVTLLGLDRNTKKVLEDLKSGEKSVDYYVSRKDFLKERGIDTDIVDKVLQEKDLIKSPSVIEKVTSPLFSALKQISRPGFGATTALYEIGEGETDVRKIGAAARKGIALDPQRKSGIDIVNQQISKWKKLEAESGMGPLIPEEFKPSQQVENIAKQAVGFGVDVVTDPLFVLQGPIKAGTGALGSFLKNKALAPIARTKIGQVIGGAFSKDFALRSKYPVLAEKAAELEDTLSFLQGKSIDEARKLAKMVPDKTRRDLITNVLEDPTFLARKAPTTQLSRKEGKILEVLKKSRDKISTGYVDRGLLTEERLLDNYVRHVRDKTGGLVNRFKSFLRGSSPGSLKARKLKGTIDEIADKAGKKIFENDIAIIEGVKRSEAARAFASHDYLKKVADDFGKPLEKIIRRTKKGMPRSFKGKIVTRFAPADDGFKTVNHMLFEGKQVPVEVADHITKIEKNFVNDKSIDAFFKTYDKALGWWKGQVLVSPAYHARNVVGNFWNNWLADVKDPNDYLKAGGLQIKMRQGKGLTKADRVLIDEARRHGVIDKGWYAADIADDVLDKLRKPSFLEALNPLDRRNFLIKGNRAVGSAIENQARLAHFIAKRKSMDAAGAALSVKKYLFDYTNLAPFEQQVLKRALPFYSWSRKNIPLQIEHMLTKPYKYSRVGQAIRGVERKGTEKEIENMPGWMKERLAIPLFKKNDQVYNMVLENWLPAADVNKLLRPDELWNMSTPFLKTPVEMMFNYSVFMGRPLEQRPGERKQFRLGKLAYDVPARTVAPIVQQVRVLNEISKLSKNFDKWPEWVRFASGGKLYKYDPDLQEYFNELKASGNIRDAIRFLRKLDAKLDTAEDEYERRFLQREIERTEKELDTL